MVQKRSRFMPGFQSRFLPNKTPVPPVTKRSTVRALGTPFYRRSLDDDVLYVPHRPSYIPHYSYDTSANEYATHSDISRELIMSSAAMEDNYDITNRSRQRDRDVLAAANRAITASVDSPAPVEPSNSSSAITTSSGYKSRRSGTRRSQASRSHSVPPKRPTYTTTTAILPLDLKASAPPKPSPFLNYSHHLDNTKALRGGSYEPLYSSIVRTDSPMRDISPFRLESPFRSDSPYREMSPSLETTSRLVKKRLKPPRVIANKRRVGNYYDRLLSKRAKGGGKQCKYWPYINVEDIENESLADVLSDTEPDPNISYETGYEYVITGDGESSAHAPLTYSSSVHVPLSYSSDDLVPVTYSSDEFAPTTYSSNELVPLTYSSSYEPESDIPDEYVPFRPKPRQVSPERDYSQLSVIPYLPARDPTKNTVEDDISFNAVVAASAARARRALENINWDDYDSAGLVLSVEGEYKPPEEDTPYGFRYVSRPIMLKVPASQRVRAADSDNAFTKYMTDLQKFREGIRARLEDGYKAISRETASCVAPTLPAVTSYSSSYTPSYNRPISRSYRTRLTEDAGYKHGHSLELYPLTSGSRSRYLTSSDDTSPQSSALKLYDSKTDKYSKLGTLARVEIKVDTELHSTPKSAVAAMRVTRGHSTPPASKLSRNEAALLANKVEVNLPERKGRRPRSSYAQAKMRQLRKDKQMDEGDFGTTAATVEPTSGLKAHAPVYDPSLAKRFWDSEGVKKPNIMSWKYRLDTYAAPDDMIIVPRSLGAVRSQLKDAHDKLDRHRQLMDRYLLSDQGLNVDDQIALAATKAYLGERA